MYWIIRSDCMYWCAMLSSDGQTYFHMNTHHHSYCDGNLDLWVHVSTVRRWLPSCYLNDTKGCMFATVSCYINDVTY